MLYNYTKEYCEGPLLGAGDLSAVSTVDYSGKSGRRIT